ERELWMPTGRCHSSRHHYANWLPTHAVEDYFQICLRAPLPLIKREVRSSASRAAAVDHVATVPTAAAAVAQLDFYTNVLGLEKRVENPTPDRPRSDRRRQGGRLSVGSLARDTGADPAGDDLLFKGLRVSDLWARARPQHAPRATGWSQEACRGGGDE